MTWLVICGLLAASGNAERIVFRWAPLSDAVSYELQIASDPEFRNILHTERTKVAGYRWKRIGTGIVYFRVRGWDADGVPGEWSEPREVEAQKEPEKPPEPPPIVAPSIEGPRSGTWWRVSAKVQLKWAAAAEAKRWQVEIREPRTKKKRSEETSSPKLELQPSWPGMHRWRVRVLEPEGPWSAWATIDVRLPPPVLEAPKKGSSLPCGEVALSWRAVESAAGYHVEVARDKEFKDLVKRKSVTEVTWTTPALEGGAYWWRVTPREARRRNGFRAASEFVVVCLGVPKLVGPEGGALFELGREVPFAWEVVPEAARYDLEIAGAMRPSASPAMAVTDLGTGEYSWRVRAVTARGDAGPWSETRSLRVDPRRTVSAKWTPEAPKVLIGGEAVLDVELFDAEGVPVREAPISADTTSGTVSVSETDSGYRVVFRAPETVGEASIEIRDRDFVARTTVGLEEPPRRWQLGARAGWQLSGLGSLGSPALTLEVLYDLPWLPMHVSARVGYLRHAATIPAGDAVPAPIDQVAHVVPVTLAGAFVASFGDVDLYAGGGLVVQIATLSVGPESGATARVGFEALGGGAYRIGPGFACAELSVSVSGLDADLLRLPTDTFLLTLGYRFELPIY